MKSRLQQIIAFIKRRPLASLAGVFVAGILGIVLMHQVEAVPQIACSPCHVMQPYVEGYHHDDILAHKHAEAGVACIDCHDNGIEDKVQETVWYITDDFDEVPEKRAFDNSMCLKCHDVKTIVEKTNYKEGNPHDSHLGDLVCSDCHYSHEKSKAACQECHNFDFLQNLPPEWETKADMEARKAKN